MDITTREDDALSLYISGDPDRGRAMFREIFTEKLDLCRDCYQPSSKWFAPFEFQLHSARASHPSPEEWTQAVEQYRMHVLSARAGTLEQCVRTVESWQKAEMWLRLAQGVDAPEAVASEILAAATALLPFPPILSASGESLRLPEQKWYAREVESATQVYGRALRYTLAFLRGTHLEGERAKLLDTARQYVDLPQSVEEFDLQNPSLAEIFRIYIPKGTPITEPPPTPRRRRLDKNDPIALLVENILRKAYEVDLDYVKSLCVEGYWPEQQIQQELWELNQDTLLGIGTVHARDIGNDEIEVSVEDIETVNPEGKLKPGRTDLILRRTADGEYKISYFGTEGQREAEKTGGKP